MNWWILLLILTLAVIVAAAAALRYGTAWEFKRGFPFVVIHTSQSKFLPAIGYRPTCDPTTAYFDRESCKGFTSGWMPAIEDGRDGDFLCAGYIGTFV